jgi:hypothetical protein
LFFISLNIVYLFDAPFWENGYKLTPVKELIENSKRKNLVYVATNYRANPQFSFYFKGIDIGWVNYEYNFTLLDTKTGDKNVFDKLLQLTPGESNILVEKDNINRTEYGESSNFIPPQFKLIRKTFGYELYEN